MKPVSMETYLGEDALLLLNTKVVGPRYVKQLLARDNSDIRSNGGIALPNELWDIILKLANEGKDKFCLAKASVVSRSSNIVILRCVRHEFGDPDDPEDEEFAAGCLGSTEKVRSFEAYLGYATSSSAAHDEVELPELTRLSGPENTYTVVLDTTSADSCLYNDLEVPDIISRIEDGYCLVCNGTRYICPGCTGGVAQKFDAFMGCGVDLVCPLCVGVDFCMDHKRFLERNYWNDPSEEEAADMKKLVEDRLNELGYTDAVPPSVGMGEFF
ncbi:hypothetical protein M426DRAFT_15332 [Hypoxylon sp. CI-4A]|nr:hypothetical protein M426DRAFT_15332 [Hypoxylon sp. CI-4A]